MNEEERIEKQRILLEEVGRYFDKQGFQPIAGRVLGLLLVMDKEQFTFDEIAEELNISKSSVSNVLRNLEARGDIEYTTIPGDRKKYYHLKRTAPTEMFEEFYRKLQIIKTFFQRIIELKEDKHSKNTVFFEEIIEIISYYERNYNYFKNNYKLK